MNDQADLDQITDHPFLPGSWPDICHHQHEGWYGWMCGYTREEHAP
jgi:hypothetical protein